MHVHGAYLAFQVIVYLVTSLANPSGGLHDELLPAVVTLERTDSTVDFQNDSHIVITAFNVTPIFRWKFPSGISEPLQIEADHSATCCMTVSGTSRFVCTWSVGVATVV